MVPQQNFRTRRHMGKHLLTMQVSMAGLSGSSGMNYTLIGAS